MSGTIVVGWTPDDYGRVAVEYAAAEAGLRDADLLVVNATRGDALVDEKFARKDELLMHAMYAGYVHDAIKR